VIKQTIEIAERPARLSLKQRQLKINVGDTMHSFACEDIGVVVLHHPAISLTAAVLNALLDSGAVVVICGNNHMPTGMLLPTITHTELVPRMMAQIASPLPSRKRLWKAIVKAKIAEQAERLTDPYRCRLKRLSQMVKSGDLENSEAQAARIYWSARFPIQYETGDKRDPESASLFNSALNYGYAVVRAATARALVAAGMHPALGVFHRRRNNPFCLADDVMEPLRPIVDDCVYDLLQGAHSSMGVLTQDHRRQLLQILSTEVKCDSFTGPLLVALSRYVNNVFNILSCRQSNLFPPRRCLSTDTNACG
jgi:CRISP-associated protein Cas1